ncbi:MAG: hypothetical protein LBQ47_02325 [Endomicrobium sp.]|jgi:hypothetical protein|nr:hypothetical protein [Endomicrobium sp.]
MRKIFVALLVSFFAVSFVYAEYFYLRNGDEINGKIVSETTSSVTIAVAGSGTKKTVAIKDIWEISATKKKVAPKAADTYGVQESKTQFTSSNKTDFSSAETHITDNKSGVIVYGVTDTDSASNSAAQPSSDDDFDAAAYLLGGGSSKQEAKTSAEPASAAKASAKPSAAKPSDKNDVSAESSDDFDAAAYLLGNSAASSSASSASSSSVQQEPVQTKSSQTKSARAAKKEKKSRKVSSDGDFDAAAFLLSGGDAPASSSKPEPKEPAASSSDDNFDAAAYLLGGSSSSKSSSSPKESSSSDDDNFDAAAFLLGQEVKTAEEPEPQPAEDHDDKIYDASKYKVKEYDYEYSSHPSDKPENETLIAMAIDLKGSVNFDGTAKMNGSNMSLSETSDYGISVAAEHYAYLNKIVAVGFGIGYEFQRHFNETGRYSFLPIYAVVKARIISGEDYHVYAAAHAGYSHLIADSPYWQEEARGGLYYAGGAGVSYKHFVFQILYSASSGNLKYSLGNDELNGDLKFSKIGLYFGYLF